MICRFSPRQAPTPLLVTVFHVISLHSLPQTCRAHSPTLHFLFPLCGRPGYSQMGSVLSFKSLLTCYLLRGSSLATHSGAPPPTLPDALPTLRFISSLTLNMICNCLVEDRSLQPSKMAPKEPHFLPLMPLCDSLPVSVGRPCGLASNKQAMAKWCNVTSELCPKRLTSVSLSQD